MYIRRHFKEATLCHPMCSVYDNYTVNLLCSRRDNNINNSKLAEGTALTQKGLEVYKEENQREVRAAVQGRVQGEMSA